MASDYFTRQIFLEDMVAFKIKGACFEKSVKYNKRYDLHHFYTDALKFLKKTKLKNLLTSFHYQEKNTRAVVIYFPLETETFYLETVDKLSARFEDFSERRMILTAILLYLEHETGYRHPKLEEIQQT